MVELAATYSKTQNYCKGLGCFTVYRKVQCYAILCFPTAILTGQKVTHYRSLGITTGTQSVTHTNARLDI